MSEEIDAVYVYEHAALSTITRAKKMGKAVFYEQPSQHHSFFSKVLKRQIQRYPEIRNEFTDVLNDRKNIAINSSIQLLMC